MHGARHGARRHLAQLRRMLHELARTQRVVGGGERDHRGEAARRDRTDDIESERVIARVATLRDLRRRYRLHRDLVRRSRDGRGDGLRELDEPRRILADVERRRGAAPAFSGSVVHAGPSARYERRAGGMPSQIRWATPGASHVPASRPVKKHRPTRCAEVERPRAGAWLVETRAEPTEIVRAALERAQRGREIGRGLHDHLVEVRRPRAPRSALRESTTVSSRVACFIGPVPSGASAVKPLGTMATMGEDSARTSLLASRIAKTSERPSILGAGMSASQARPPSERERAMAPAASRASKALPFAVRSPVRSAHAKARALGLGIALGERRRRTRRSRRACRACRRAPRRRWRRSRLRGDADRW